MQEQIVTDKRERENHIVTHDTFVGSVRVQRGRGWAIEYAASCSCGWMPMPTFKTEQLAQDRATAHVAVETYRAGVDRRTDVEAFPVRPEDRGGVVGNVIERLDVYAVLASTHVLHHNVKRQHAQRIVEAVLALTACGEQQ